MYDVILPKSVSKQIGKLHPKVRGQVLSRLAELGDEPRPTGCKKLVAEEDLYRVRIGAFRAIYSIDDDARRVVIVRVGHRREVHGK